MYSTKGMLTFNILLVATITAFSTAIYARLRGSPVPLILPGVGGGGPHPPGGPGGGPHGGGGGRPHPQS